MIQLLLVLVSAWSGSRVHPTRPATGAGGPDSYGYRYIDNDTNAGNPPVFVWHSIRETGTRIQGLLDDNVVGPFEIGFDFPYYWYRVNSVYMCSNGYISFGDPLLAASPFDNLPSANRPNNVIAPLMTDLTYLGSSNPGKAFYWTNSAQDTFIVECDSVPFWQPSSPSGINTFQIILSKLDSSIAFMYKQQQGSPYNGWNQGYATVGMENVTGAVGLSYLYGSTPSQNNIHDTLAVRFYPPESSSYQVHDVATWRVMNEDNGGIFLLANAPTTLWAKVKNTGNQDENNVPVYCTVRDESGNLVYADTLTTGQLASGEVDSLVFDPDWSPGSLGQYIIQIATALSGDMFHGNDTISVETHVVAFPAELSYDHGSSNYSTSWQGNCGGYGAKFFAPEYPVEVIAIRACLRYGTSPVGCTLWLFQGNGPNGSPGTVLGRGLVLVDSSTPTWYRVDMLPPVRIDSGGFFVGVTSDGSSDPNYCMDTLRPISLRTWEFTGGWSPGRDISRRDMLMHPLVRFQSSTGDVGVTSILAPTGTIDSNQSLTPACSVYNYGTTAASYNVRMRIGGFYSVVAPVTNHTPGTARAVNFSNSSSWRRGTQAITCSTEFSGDVNPSNDRRTGSVQVRVLDAGLSAIVSPSGTIDSGSAVAPKAMVHNFGTEAASFRCRMRIGTSYTDSADVSGMGPGDSALVSFALWTARARGQNACRCSTMLAGDMNPPDDVISQPVTVRVLDAGAVRVLAPRGLVQRGDTVDPRAEVRNYSNVAAVFRVRFRVGATYNETCQASVPAGRADTVQFLPWIAQSLGTFVTTCTTELAGDVYPSNDRVNDSVIVVAVGAEEAGAGQAIPKTFVLQGGFPNPFADATQIAYGLPVRCAVTLRIYNSSGFLICHLSTPVQRPGFHRVFWEGRDGAGRPVAKGVYFCRLEAGDALVSKKLVKLE